MRKIQLDLPARNQYISEPLKDKGLIEAPQETQNSGDITVTFLGLKRTLFTHDHHYAAFFKLDGFSRGPDKSLVFC